MPSSIAIRKIPARLFSATISPRGVADTGIASVPGHQVLCEFNAFEFRSVCRDQLHEILLGVIRP
jgi:hypothetical protein